MSTAKRRDTQPELAIRSGLHRAGLRFYVDRPALPAEGRRRRVDIVFPTDGFVSSSHATLYVAPDRVLIRDGIRDKHSSNGTFLRLTAPAFVENGDQFLIGRQLDSETLATAFRLACR